MRFPLNQLVILFSLPRHFLNIISGPILDLHVYLTDVFAHNTQTDEDGAAHKPDGEDDGRPAGNDIVQEHGMDDTYFRHNYHTDIIQNCRLHLIRSQA